MTNERGIREGMTVYSSDGEKLGTVRACDAYGFFIEKGFFFPKEHFARYEHVANVSGEDVQLAIAKDMLNPDAGSDAELRDRGSYATRGDDLSGERRDTGLLGRERDDLKMTRAEEELDVAKRQREAGEVRLHKEVVTETKHIDVPVTREEVHVERTPVDAPRPAAAGEARFQEETRSIPLVEEEVEIRKRPVVKEEVRVRRDRIQQEQRASADVRKEEIHVDDESKDRTTRDDLGMGGLGAPGRDPDDVP